MQAAKLSANLSTRQQALKCYKKLLRTRLVVFKGKELYITNKSLTLKIRYNIFII